MLKLFVWEGVLADYTDGIAFALFALAHNVEEARMVIQRDSEDWMDLSEIHEEEPLIFESPKGFTLYGGG